MKVAPSILAGSTDPLFKLPAKQKRLSTKTKAAPKVGASIAAFRKRIESKFGGLPANYHVINNKEELGKLARQISTHRRFAWDTETSGLDRLRDSVYCVSFWVNGEGYLANFSHPLLPQVSKTAFRQALQQYFDGPYERIEFTGNFDRIILEQDLEMTTGDSYWDTFLGVWLVDETLSSKKLKDIAGLWLGDTDSAAYGKEFGNKAWIVLDPLVASYYAIHDAEVTYGLYELEREAISKDRRLLLMTDLEMPFANNLIRTERAGIKVDVPYLTGTVKDHVIDDLQNLEARLNDMAGKEARWSNDEEVASVLFETLKLPRINGNSTAVGVLEELETEHEIVPVLKDWRVLHKVLTGFVTPIEHVLFEGRIHMSFKGIGTASGRPSASDINILQIPNKGVGLEVRQAFIADDGFMFVSKDIKQQEMFIQAALAQDDELLRVLFESDIYAEAAAVFWGGSASDYKKGEKRRDLAKRAMLAITYGAQAPKIAKIFECSVSRADQFIHGLYTRFPRWKQWQDEVVAFGRKHGYVETFGGRRRHVDFSQAFSRGYTNRLERICTNSPVQGGAADFSKAAFNTCAQYFREQGLQSRILFQIYDEFLFMVEPSEWACIEPQVDAIIRTAVDFGFPWQISSEEYKIGTDGVSRWGRP